MLRRLTCLLFFFFNDTATTEIYTLSLHDALPICSLWFSALWLFPEAHTKSVAPQHPKSRDRKSTRLNSSHQIISYAVFCLKKKKNDDWSYCTMRVGIISKTKYVKAY